MPYKRVGSTVYVNRGGHWEKKGSSSSPEKAKRYLRALYAHEPKNDMKKAHKPGDLLMAFKAKVAKHEAKEAKTGKPEPKMKLGHLGKMNHHAKKITEHAHKLASLASKVHQMKPKGARGRAQVARLGRTTKTGGFAKIAKKAGKKYGSAEKGKKVAGAIFHKMELKRKGGAA